MNPQAAFERFLAPFSADEFLSSVYGHRPLYVAGESDRFAYLLPWEELNRILAQHRFDQPRLRIAKDKEVPEKVPFIRYGFSKGVKIPHINQAIFTRELREGATIVLDAIDELHEPITQLARNLEYVLCDSVQANTYAGWYTKQGFDTHWDDHDVFIVQVAGHKDWRIFKPERMHPVPEDRALELKPPTEIWWKGPLNPGDVLYIPRGWWHDAVPVNEATLHLTFALVRHSGLSIIGKLIQLLRDHEIMRRDLPRHETAATRGDYMNALRETVIKTLDGFSMEAYFREIDAARPARVRMSLPGSAVPERQEISNTTWVHWLAPRPVQFEEADDKAWCETFGEKFNFESVALPLLKTLSKQRSLQFGQLCQAHEEIAPTAIQNFVLTELVSVGLVAIAERELI